MDKLLQTMQDLLDGKADATAVAAPVPIELTITEPEPQINIVPPVAPDEVITQTTVIDDSVYPTNIQAAITDESIHPMNTAEDSIFTIESEQPEATSSSFGGFYNNLDDDMPF